MWVCRSKAYSLFKFEGSYHAMTMNSYLMEQAAGQGGVDALDAGLSVTGEWFPSFQADTLMWEKIRKSQRQRVIYRNLKNLESKSLKIESLWASLHYKADSQTGPTNPWPVLVLQMAMQLVLVVEVEVVEVAVNTRGREHLYVLPLLTTSRPYSTLFRSSSERLRRLLAVHLGKIITKWDFMFIIFNIRHLFQIFPQG